MNVSVDTASTNVNESAASPSTRGSIFEVFAVALRLGFTSFGGPIAHLGYFREEYVVRRKWLDERSYADLVALGQFLPGPASSQVGVGADIARAGLAGAVAAWLGFNLPSARALVLFAFGVDALGGAAAPSRLHGLKVVTVVLVAQGLSGIAKELCPDRVRPTSAIRTALVALCWPSAAGQVLSISPSLGAGPWLRAPTALMTDSHTKFR